MNGYKHIVNTFTNTNFLDGFAYQLVGFEDSHIVLLVGYKSTTEHVRDSAYIVVYVTYIDNYIMGDFQPCPPYV